MILRIEVRNVLGVSKFENKGNEIMKEQVSDKMVLEEMVKLFKEMERVLAQHSGQIYDLEQEIERLKNNK